MKNKIITVIGAGNSGLATAAHLAKNGYSVHLWNRSAKPIKKISATKKINFDGIIRGNAKIQNATTDIKVALKNSYLIMVTTPASSHKDIARTVSPHVNKDSIILLNPGRTFGAIEFKNELQKTGCKNDPIVAETQTILYTCRKTAEDSVKILEFKRDILVSSFNEESTKKVLERLPKCLQIYFKPATSMIETSLGNVGMVLHCAPVLFNIGWIEYQNVCFKYYYNGITPSISEFLEKIDNERIQVAECLNRTIESTAEWLQRIYGATGSNLYECIQSIDCYKEIDAPDSINHRYIHEDVPTGLVPLEGIGKELNMEMRNTTLVIDLANSILKTDFRKNGRNLGALGYKKNNISDLFKLLEPQENSHEVIRFDRFKKERSHYSWR